VSAGPVAKVDVACPHCGATDAEHLWNTREHEYAGTTDEEFTFVRCGGCGLVRLDPRPDVGELGRIYPPDYYAYNLISEDGGEGEGVADRLKRRMYQRRLGALIERLGKSGPLRLLDVGCADGRLLDWYRSSPAGARLETHGIELDGRAAAIARRRGHRVVEGRFEVDEELEPGSFDLILAYHVIEHVADPLAFARRAAELLSPGGLLVVATPNWDSPDARRLAGRWGGNHTPRHWTLYDERTLRDLSERVDLAFERVEYQPNPIFWVWSCHASARERFPGHRWPDRLFPPVEIFSSSARSFVLLSVFTMLDLLLRAISGRTASFGVELRKPSA
jgi:SAM-dependent methyltransferase